MPPLLHWLPRYAASSALSILATYLVLRRTQRARLRRPVRAGIDRPALSAGGRMAAFGIVATALVLLASSGLGIPLGRPTLLAGLATAILVLTRSRNGVGGTARTISWGVPPLVAGLFVLVQALEQTGVTRALAGAVQGFVQHSAMLPAWGVGVALAVGCIALAALAIPETSPGPAEAGVTLKLGRA